MAQIDKLIPYTIPAPVGGLNVRDPIMEMPPRDATSLTNVTCKNQTVDKREGYKPYALGITDSQPVLSTLATLKTVTGGEKLVGFLRVSNFPGLYDISEPGVYTSINPAGITANDFQWTNFRNNLVACDGSNAAWHWAGTGVAAFTSWTGVTTSELISVCAYRKRLYFTQKNSSKVWYGNPDATSGALTEFDFQSEFTKGGYLVYCASSNQRTGNLSDEVFVAVSSQGEVVVYVGSYPGDDSWTQMGHYFIGRPLGRRSFFRVGSELYFITDQGVISFTDIVGSNMVGGKYQTMSDKIDPLLQSMSVHFDSATAGVFSWEGCWYPKENCVVINANTAPSVNGSLVPTKQLVVNPQTRAWSTWDGLNAASIVEYKNNLYFATGKTRVYKMDGYNDIILNSVAASIPRAVEIDIKQAPTACNNPAQNKHFKIAKTYVTANSRPKMTVAMDVDFGHQSLTQIAWVGNGSATENAYANIHGLAGLGLYGALRLTSSVSDTSFKYAGTTLCYEKAGFS